MGHIALIAVLAVRLVHDSRRHVRPLPRRLRVSATAAPCGHTHLGHWCSVGIVSSYSLNDSVDLHPNRIEIEEKLECMGVEPSRET